MKTAVMIYVQGERSAELYRALKERFDDVVEVRFGKQFGSNPEFANGRSSTSFDWRVISNANFVAYQNKNPAIGHRETVSLLWQVHISAGHRTPSRKLWCPTLKTDGVEDFDRALDDLDIFELDEEETIQTETARAEPVLA